MIQKLWVKFDETAVVCLCEENRKKCTKEEKPECKEYVVKFIEIERGNTEEAIKVSMTNEEKAMKDLVRKVKRYDTELKKAVKKFKVR
jgi:hypothetical protein